MPLLAQASIAVLVGYLFGCFPSAYIAGRICRKADIRQLGDGNAGAENVCNELGPRTGLAVAAADIGKGILAVAIFRVAAFPETAALSAGATAVVGHNWPIFLQFRGGRGAATTAGALIMALNPVALIPAGIAIALALSGKGTGTAGPLRSDQKGGGGFSGMTFGVALFAPLPLLAWVLGYPLYLVFYALGLPIVVGIVHFYEVVLPFFRRTGRLSLRARE